MQETGIQDEETVKIKMVTCIGAAGRTSLKRGVNETATTADAQLERRFRSLIAFRIFLHTLDTPFKKVAQGG